MKVPLVAVINRFHCSAPVLNIICTGLCYLSFIFMISTKFSLKFKSKTCCHIYSLMYSYFTFSEVQIFFFHSNIHRRENLVVNQHRVLSSSPPLHSPVQCRGDGEFTDEGFCSISNGWGTLAGNSEPTSQPSVSLGCMRSRCLSLWILKISPSLQLVSVFLHYNCVF